MVLMVDKLNNVCYIWYNNQKAPPAGKAGEAGRRDYDAAGIELVASCNQLASVPYSMRLRNSFTDP